ncbi:uncharacterized protein LOC123529329 isoform X1 [Mercenaria mercenaria]|uniref:uncharacterized protein LOC123529329 isoform X1 n=1 Tax=Mercenaria mercenaria TaxID=6596 RepID=UPI00234EE449|nr:uncharacterized protein LOC123529329 isoform X1 [Mercenaria mercenaria]
MNSDKLRKGTRKDYKRMQEGPAEDELSSSSMQMATGENEGRALPAFTSPGKIGLIEEIPEGPEIASGYESDDAETMKKELALLEQEESRLRKLNEKAVLRQKLEEKRAEVKKLQDVVRRVVILGDSIVKFLPPIEGVTVQSFPGATVGKLSFLVSKKRVNLYDKHFIILHVGTNNISNQDSLASMSSDFSNLIAAIRTENPSIRIIVSSVLPRPVDHEITESCIKEYNRFLEDILAADLDFKFIRSYRPFCFKGSVKRYLFAKLDGGLHLNSEGANRLRHFFLRVISTLS